ncbi:hypothetical protein [Rhizobium sp. L51/94]|uniref:hypothetical protein n=1 Tax=Rhizobium sp. L51/94 TaxID=2819999 RepID=UPI001C5AA0A7|nr:hypothetical protein [Rhizobium sp. L51/94]QXZ79649.1 hypothetical protein J5274_06615 [Rhizobium sp. L51/94]
MFSSFGYRLFDCMIAAIGIVASAIELLARAFLRVDYGYAWRAMREVGVASYRDVVGLHPVYRESYETHGLSLQRRRYGV